MTKDLTGGTPWRLILSYSMPLVLGNLFQMIYNIVNSIVVGRFISTEALAAVGSAGQIATLMNVVIIGLVSGFAIPMARSFGAADNEKVNRFFAGGILISAAVSLFVAVSMHFLTMPVLRLMGTPENIISDGYSYARIMFYGCAATAFNNFFIVAVRALGDAKSPFIFLTLGSLLNIGFDLLFVLVFNLGVGGTAFAFAAANFSAALFSFFFIRRRYPVLKISRSSFSGALKGMSELLKNGVPMSAQCAVTSVGTLVLTFSINKLGSDFIAAFAAVNKAFNILYLPVDTIGVAAATFASQNLGAGKIRRIRTGVNSALFINLCLSTGMGLVFFFFGTTITNIFLRPDAAAGLQEYVWEYSKILAFFFPVLAFIPVYRSATQGLGFGGPATLAGVCEMFGRGIASFLIPVFGKTAAYLAAPAAWIAADGLLLPVYFIVTRRLRRTIVDTEEHPPEKEILRENN